MTPTRRHVTVFTVLILILAIPVLYLIFLLLGLKQSPTEVEPTPQPPLDRPVSIDIAYHGEPVGLPVTGRPWIPDLQIHDLDQDGLLDILVCDGVADTVSWIRQFPKNQFTEHILAEDIKGPAHIEACDIDQDGDLDIIALVSQEWEEIHLFENDGTGNFNNRIIWASTNEDYGSSGLQLVDLDRDGDLDIIYTNGDGFDYAKPGPRPWHGIQWLENRGRDFSNFIAFPTTPEPTARWRSI